MNKDIETVEGALQSVLDANERRHQAEMATKAAIEEKKLRDFLANVPQATFNKDDSSCEAFVDGIRFYFEPGEYGDYLTANHKMVRRFLWKQWVGQHKHYFTSYCKPLSWVLRTHLDALKFESDQKNGD